MVYDDCVITEEMKKDYILGHQKDDTLIGYSNMVGDDKIVFLHNASNSSVCGPLLQKNCNYAIIIYSSSQQLHNRVDYSLTVDILKVKKSKLS